MIPCEQLAPYLAYDLEFYGGSDIWKMIGLAYDGAVVLDNGLRRMIIEPEQVGVEYVPILRHFNSWCNIDDIKQTTEVGKRLIGSNNVIFALQSTMDANFYFKHKFDVFGLIEKNLAEDAAKFNQNGK